MQKPSFYVVLLCLVSQRLALSFIACDTLFCNKVSVKLNPNHAHVPGGETSKAADVVSSPQKQDHVKTSCPYCLAALPALRVEVWPLLWKGMWHASHWMMPFCNAFHCGAFWSNVTVWIMCGVLSSCLFYLYRWSVFSLARVERNPFIPEEESRRQNAFVEPQLLRDRVLKLSKCNFLRLFQIRIAVVCHHSWTHANGLATYWGMLTDVSEQKRIQLAEVSVSVFSTSFADFFVGHDSRRQEGYLGPMSLQPQKPAFWLVSDKSTTWPIVVLQCFIASSWNDSTL